jgi:hypothetical protein
LNDLVQLIYLFIYEYCVYPVSFTQLWSNVLTNTAGEIELGKFEIHDCSFVVKGFVTNDNGLDFKIIYQPDVKLAAKTLIDDIKQILVTNHEEADGKDEKKYQLIVNKFSDMITKQLIPTIQSKHIRYHPDHLDIHQLLFNIIEDYFEPLYSEFRETLSFADEHYIHDLLETFMKRNYSQYQSSYQSEAVYFKARMIIPELNIEWMDLIHIDPKQLISTPVGFEWGNIIFFDDYKQKYLNLLQTTQPNVKLFVILQATPFHALLTPFQLTYEFNVNHNIIRNIEMNGTFRYIYDEKKNEPFALRIGITESSYFLFIHKMTPFDAWLYGNWYVRVTNKTNNKDIMVGKPRVYYLEEVQLPSSYQIFASCEQCLTWVQVLDNISFQAAKELKVTIQDHVNY